MADSRFDYGEDQALANLVHVVAYNALTDRWGIYNLDTLREIPTYLVAHRDLTRAERQTAFETRIKTNGRIVQLYFFARVEPGKVFTMSNPR